jgi:hypothetical protein
MAVADEVRVVDVAQAACAVAFAVACCYHACHVDPRGFVQSDFLGLPSYTWRTVDILCAQFLLGRTFGQAIGAKGALLQGQSQPSRPAVAQHNCNK